ncbi:MAG: lytic transglycosylase domain-containing protein [Treponema sp.]|jgi:hypothetical protein|nr:lytic transglycosylase domain-containing protein [Treponema sp.]
MGNNLKLSPLFMGGLISLVFCAMIAVHIPAYQNTQIDAVVDIINEIDDDPGIILSGSAEEKVDLIKIAFKDDDYTDWVITFFAEMCSDREIARAILENADIYGVSPALAFALSWEESRFNPHAVNSRNSDESIDRGLFQLNSRSFPNIEVNVFFDIKHNARYGISHLKHCLNLGGNEIAALAIYNAGSGKVRNSGAPRVTLDYIYRILENRNKIEKRFNERLVKKEGNSLAEKNKEQDQTGFYRTLISASPL